MQMSLLPRFLRYFRVAALKLNIYILVLIDTPGQGVFVGPLPEPLDWLIQTNPEEKPEEKNAPPRGTGITSNQRMDSIHT